MWRLPLLVSALLLSACNYSLRAPTPLPQGLRIDIPTSEARLAAIRGSLHRQLGNEVRRQLGWPVSPSGNETLRIHLEREDISSVAENSRGIADRWRIRVHARTEFRTRQAAFVDSAYYASIDDETAAIERATAGIARDIARWLEMINTPR